MGRRNNSKYFINCKEIIMKDTFPVLHLVLTDRETNEEICSGWLSPFRKYAFQISGSVDGSGDLGSTEVFGLKNLLHMQSNGRGNGYQTNMSRRETAEAMTEYLAIYCMVKWCNYIGEHDVKYPECKAWEENDVFTQWTKCAVDFIES